ncbi:MoeA family protein [Fodinicola feengrottensis]|uniref:hypothetical protein n=1 Tax=Fodinicola feengrottensis TaxID=435914 RepID=UPI0024430463|nr:hypothetical protein [Fodinicola feengrottensis]
MSSEVSSGGVGLADYLSGVLSEINPLRPFDLALHDAHAGVLATDVQAPGPLPPFDMAAVDGYALRADDVSGATERLPARLSVIGDVTSTSWKPTRLTGGSCFSVAAGAPLPAGADTVVPTSWTDGGLVVIEVADAPRRGSFVRRTGDDVAAGTVMMLPGRDVRVGRGCRVAGRCRHRPCGRTTAPPDGRGGHW